MSILPKAIARSLGVTLFIAVVSTGMLGFLAIPWVGQQFGPLVCDSGEMTYETYSWSTGNESGINVVYYCDDGDGAPEEVSFWRLLLAGGLSWYGLVLVVVWPLLTLRNYRKMSNESRLMQDGVRTPARLVSVSQTNVRINKQPLLNLTFEIEPMNRANYELSKKMTLPYIVLSQLTPGKRLTVIVDPKNPKNILVPMDELTQGVAGDAGTSADGRVDRLEALKEMLDKGLIDQWEYDEKKDDILKDL